MSTLLIAGIGSYNEGDQWGWRVARLLKKILNAQLQFPFNIALKCYRSPMVLLNDLSGVERLVCLDAFVSNADFPEVVSMRFPEEWAVQRGVDDKISSHQMSLPAALHLAQSLQMLPDCVIIYGINADILSKATPTAMFRNMAKQIATDLTKGHCYITPSLTRQRASVNF